jgi:hypothetical protein
MLKMHRFATARTNCSPTPLKTALSSPLQYGTNGIWNKNARGVIPLAFDFFQARYRSKTYLSATWWQQPLMKKAAFQEDMNPQHPGTQQNIQRRCRNPQWFLMKLNRLLYTSHSTNNK